ncbi:MAG: adenylate/guanylate cyclase domain-containing protein [Actinomycetota bacterium]|nr:adenylate/guanylate cyclase domain-containing protein [Actinomycetota bacterium]
MGGTDTKVGPWGESLPPELKTTLDGQGWTGDLDPVRLRFRNPDIERGFRAHFASHNITNIRIGHALALILWIVWGVLMHEFMGEERGLDVLIRYGFIVPLTLLGFGLTFLPSYPRFWKWAVMAVLLVSGLTWVAYAGEVESMPSDYVYVGLILAQTFAFSILRLPFALVAMFDLVTIPFFFAFGRWSGELDGLETRLAILYLGSVSLLGLIAAYALEWKIRKLFLRERQLDYERGRSDALLLNVLPQVIIDRLKARRAAGNESRLAEAFDDVTVLFADAVGFTVQGTKTRPDELVEALDEIFCRFDELADRYGLEKIKTIGDAYMAVAGVPTPRPDHAEAATQMALAMLEELHDARWPSGDPVGVRVGMASGPAVAGVIGNRKFAYDLWGDTVNLANRLESHGAPGQILASESVVSRLKGKYVFGPPMVVNLKGKGPTPARFVLPRGQAADFEPPADAPTTQAAEA